MPFFRPPANNLEPYQLELLGSIFRKAWSEIVPRGYRLSQEKESQLQREISDRLCALAAQGVGDSETLCDLTVATVHLRPGIKRRRRPTSLHHSADRSVSQRLASS